MPIVPASVVLPVGNRQQDTLLILSTSFEARCLGFASHLRERAPRYTPESVLVVHYDERGDVAIRARTTRFAPQLMVLARRIGQRVLEDTIDPFGVVDASHSFRDLFAGLPESSSVVIDVSTLSKLHVLLLLNAARRSERVQSLRLAYTRARYGRYDTLSWGAYEPIIVPGFGRPSSNPDASTRLLLFCGLEPDRAYSIWRRFGGETIRVFVDGGANDPDRCAERAERFAGFEHGTGRIVCEAFAPDRVLELIQTQYREAEARSQYLLIAPLTTKWEVLATWAFFQLPETPRAAVVYAAPGRLNATGHTLDHMGDCFVATVW
jgi:hypothetical protein